MTDALRYQAAKLGLGTLDADSIKRTIDSLMNEGFYVDACLDALDSSPARIDEVLPAFHAALAHYGIAVPTQEEAVWQLIKHHVSLIAAGTTDSLERLSDLIADVYWDYDFHAPTKKFLGDSHGIENLIGLYWGVDDLRNRPNEISFNGEFGDKALIEIGREVRAEAERWLTRYAR